jgi:hypothetical protein
VDDLVVSQMRAVLDEALDELPGSPAPEPMRMRRPGGIARMASSIEEIFQLKRSFQSVFIRVECNS